MTIVLTPTISLIKDQCRILEEKGISATYLGSSQTDLQICIIIVDKMKKGKISPIVYYIWEFIFKSIPILNQLQKPVINEGKVEGPNEHE